MAITSSITQFYLTPYFITNLLLLIAYPVLRIFTTAGRKNLKHQDYFGFSYENSIIYTVLILAIMGYARSTSTRGFLVDVMTVGKVGVAALLVFAKFKFSIIYSIICIILWLIIPYPRYSAPNKFIRIKSVEQFDEIINSYKKQQNKLKRKHQTNQEPLQQTPFQYQDKWMYFIEFYADWVLPCTLSKQLWYRYSNKYSTERLVFLQVNVDRLPELAKRFKINTSGFSRQLPSVVIVTNGEEEMRFPPVDQNNKVKKVLKLDYKILLRYFDLESRYLQTRELTQNPSNNLIDSKKDKNNVE